MKQEPLGKKIVILGCSGSGKSTFAMKLQRLTSLPLTHLDNIWWKADRTHITRDEFDSRLHALLREEAWIIDGDYSRTYETRIAACDTVIFLDYSLEQCMEGITERIGKKRPDIPWVEHMVDPELEELVRNYRLKNRPALLALLEKYPGKQALIFTAREEANTWLRSLAAEEHAMDVIIQKGTDRYLDDCENALRLSVLGEKYFSAPGSARNAVLEGLGQGNLYIALAGEECAGFFCLLPKGAFHSFPYLHIIAVKQEYRGKGIGTAVLKEAERLAFQMAGKIFLVVADFNPDAKRFYEKNGYRQVGQIPGLYRAGITENLMMKEKE